MMCPPLNLRICRMYGHRIRVSPLHDFTLPHPRVSSAAPERCAYPFGVGYNCLSGCAHFLRKPFSRSAERLHIPEKFALQIIRHSLKLMPRHRPRNVVSFHSSVHLLFLCRREVITGQSTFPALTVHMGICPSCNALFLCDVIIKIIHRQLCSPPCVDSACRTAPGSRRG